MDNVARTRQVLTWLREWGCREVVVCAGARNAPLVVALNQATDLKTWSFFEERSAAFFALGRMKSQAWPVAVVTTSGTAAAELLPAAIEADHTGLPLILVTADRPPEYRGTGAPQAIQQVGLFSHYVEKSLDYWNENLQIEWSKRRPLHLNVCLSEPTRQELATLSEKNKSENRAVEKSSATAAMTVDSMQVTAMRQFCARCKRPAVILGPLVMSEVSLVEEWLHQTRFSIYAEALSNLSHSKLLREQMVKGGERALFQALKQGWCDGVIRVGGVPTTRIWRDLEMEFNKTPVLSLSSKLLSGLSRKDAAVLPLYSLKSWPDTNASVRPAEWTDLQIKAEQYLFELQKEYPLAEPAMLGTVAGAMPSKARIYLGNSLPIREWDLTAPQGKQWQMAGSRGANGIDGQISTFLGFAEPEDSNWAVLGDLTALYDLSAPWILNQRRLTDVNMVLINNGGGRIFSRMYGREELENPHQINFSDWAKMWNLDYQLVHSPEQFQSRATRPRVVEVIPDPQQSQKFWTAWEEFWKNT
ncbi:MAG: 2-succinyl-5-enolpyruvyl-6-hydroxy-3-cyclohexene-1-carboxylic-acid synthase [Bdellovibrionales bacterium]